MHTNRQSALAAGLILALLGGAREGWAQQEEALATAQEVFTSGALAIGVTGSGTGGYDITYEGVDQTFGRVASRTGIGLEVRRMFGNVAAVALSGEYLPGPGDGPLSDGLRGVLEIDLFLNSRGPARVYLAGLLGMEYNTYDDPAGGIGFNTTGLVVGPAAGVFLRVAKGATLGVGAEYHIADSPFSASYGDVGTGEAPDLTTPGRLVGRARMLLLLF